MRTRIATGTALMLLLLGACGPDETSNPEVLAPNADMVNGQPATATAVIDGKEYTYGCPDFPCPVLSIVTEQIDAGKYFWTAPVGGMPTIYLYVLQTPVKLHIVTQDGDIMPPEVEPVPPAINGPAEMLGAFLPPINQLVCQGVALNLVSPDNGPWDFVRGQLVLGYMDDSGEGYAESGVTTVVPLGERNWNDLLAGVYAMYPPVPGTPAYHVNFSATLRRVVGEKTYEFPVEHDMMCGSEEYFAPKPPPDPSLTGPEYVKGTRLHDRGLVCNEFALQLVAPDEGEWYYESGEMVLEYMRWGADLHRLVPTGRTTVRTMGSDMWDQLLNGNYFLKPGLDNANALAYRVTVHGIVSRDYRDREWTATVGHSFMCVGPDLYDMLVNPPR